MRLLLPVLLLGTGCSQGVSAPSAPVSTQTTQTSLSIEGMTCASCETSIKIALSKLDGVSSIEVSYDTKSATVLHDPALTSAQALADAVTGLGYTTTVSGGAVDTPSYDPEMASVCEMSCAASAESYSQADVVAQPGAQVGQLTRCPVSGVVFTVTESHASYEKDGQTWFTCCGGCMKKLEEDTARFLRG